MKSFKKTLVKTWYLEHRGEIPPLSSQISIERWLHPAIEDYLDLYKSVGKNWGWSGRLLISRNELKQLLLSEENEIWKCYHNNHLIGFFELDKSKGSKVEIVYLGLLPQYIGKGLGKDLLYTCIHTAYTNLTTTVWLHTCEFDHKNALNTYIKAGFSIKKESFDTSYYPDSFLRRKRSICD